MSKRFFISLIAMSANLTTLATAQIVMPETRKMQHQDTYHGTVITDTYRWLEDDNSEETKAWVKAQNEVTNKHLAAVSQRAPTKKLYTDLYNFEKFGIPSKEGGRYFFTRNDGLQQQAVLYSVKALKDAPSVALDPNTLSKDGTVALTGTAVSRDGKYLAYGTAGAGSDWQEWRVRDLTTGKDLADTLKWVKFSGAAWTPDNKGFFYSRYDAPKEGEKLTGVNYYQKLYFHRLGTDQSKDVLVYQDKQDKERGFGAAVSDDGKLVFINVWKGTARKNGLLWLPLKNGAYVGGEAKPIAMAFDAEYVVAGSNGNKVWIRTDANAPKGKIVAVDVTKMDRAQWKTVVEQQAETLANASVVGGMVFADYLKDAASLVRVHAPDGKLVREVALPGVGTASGFAGKFSDSETFFSYTSFTSPTEIYRYDVKTGTATLFKRPKTAFNPDEYVTKREFVTSKDGTKVPIFVAHKKGIKLDGTNPTMLYGYGGFNVSLSPSYGVTAATWLKMGGVYVSASLRGGGEYGAEWHEAGTKLRKQNVFDDFIATAEWLIANKYTSASKLGIYGGSNGGLLVGAALNQRPDLFGAAVPAVGVMDMLRFHKFTIGWAWASDYGSADNEAEFRALVKYSPLHNVKRDVAYPPVMVTTADHDDRVVPAHSFKYTAEMQAAARDFARTTAKSTGPILIRIQTDAGHGAGTPTTKIIEERSDVLAFFANALGLAVQ